MIRISNASKVYTADEVRTVALDGVSLEVAAGDYLAVMGPSGCGKTTLLNVIGLLDSLSSGEYALDGERVDTLGERARLRLRRGTVGFVFQSFNLIDELTVEQNVELPLVYLRVGASERRRRVREVLERVGVDHRRRHFPQQLSGGQQQRVAVARAVVASPRVILADEPTGNLDSANGEEVLRLLEALNAEGTTLVMVTHAASQAERARRVVHLFDGTIVSESAVRHA